MCVCVYIYVFTGDKISGITLQFALQKLPISYVSLKCRATIVAMLPCYNYLSIFIFTLHAFETVKLLSQLLMPLPHWFALQITELLTKAFL